jgi:hypothetical protein
VWGGLHVRDMMLRGALVYTEKMKENKHTFFILFSGVMGMVLDDCNIH